MSKNFFGMNGYYSLGGIDNNEELYVEIKPENIPSDLYAFWFLPSWGTVMSNDPRYRHWGKNNRPVPRILPVKRRKKK